MFRLLCVEPSLTLSFFVALPCRQNVPLEVTVRNRLIDSAVDFEFAIDRPERFDFIGSECFQWSLEGSEELTIPLQAVISTTGVYNLQSIRLTATMEDQKVPYLFPMQWMVQVNSL